MVTNICANFLNDEQVYRQAEARWCDLWKRVRGERVEWASPWLETQFRDGTPFLDGNPIFTAVNLRERRGIRVIQHEPTDTDLEFDCWLDRFGEAGDPDAVDELVIACAMSDAALFQAETLMRSWIDGGDITISIREGDRSPAVVSTQRSVREAA